MDEWSSQRSAKPSKGRNLYVGSNPTPDSIFESIMKDGWYKIKGGDLVFVENNTIVAIKEEFKKVDREVKKEITPEVERNLIALGWT